VITVAELRALAGIDAGDEYVLSVQLSLDPERQIERDYQVVFNDLVRHAGADRSQAEVRALEREAERIRRFLSGAPPQGLGVLIYACEPLEIWRVYALPVTVPDRVSLGRRLVLRPLLAFIDDYERYVGVLVDSEQARVLVVDQQDIVDFWSVIDQVPGRHKQGGWSQANFQRSRDDAIDVHLRAVSGELASIDVRTPFSRIVVGGPQEPLNRFLQLLPEHLRGRVVGRVPGEIFQSDAEFVRASLDVVREAERRDEQQIVEDLTDVAAAGGRAVRGLDAVLFETYNGSIYQLIVASGIHIEGGVCPVCDRLTTAADDRCPACGSAVGPLPDVVEEVVRRAIVSGCDVEIVAGPAAEELIERTGGVAARLRFVAAAPMSFAQPDRASVEP
jgi:peptide subunit release factor 1 (eRF1)